LMIAIGATSWMKLKLRLGYSVALTAFAVVAMSNV
jgi:hypothetical protein